MAKEIYTIKVTTAIKMDGSEVLKSMFETDEQSTKRVHAMIDSQIVDMIIKVVVDQSTKEQRKIIKEKIDRNEPNFIGIISAKKNGKSRVVEHKDHTEIETDFIVEFSVNL